LQEGDTCNEVPTFDGGTNPVNVEALETTQVWVIHPDILRTLLKKHPEFAQKVIDNLAKNLRGLVRMVSEMAFYQVTHRLARLISEQSPDELSGTPWTQEQLAARLGTVREVVARSLKELERSGAIQLDKRRIAISDPGVLAQWAQPWN
jgi:CRP/FNR family transcriptional regulator